MLPNGSTTWSSKTEQRAKNQIRRLIKQETTIDKKTLNHLFTKKKKKTAYPTLLKMMEWGKWESEIMMLNTNETNKTYTSVD